LSNQSNFNPNYLVNVTIGCEITGHYPNVIILRKEPLSCCRFPLTGVTIVELKAQKIKGFKSPLIGGLDKVKSLDFSLSYTE
jgi:hypothetical protein